MSFSKRNLNKGFTLVELLVTISIFVILTGVVLWNQTKFNSSILLTNLAYDTALTIRQAQTYGINVREFNGTGQFFPYGVHFETGVNSKSFILFADLDNNGVYDGTPTDGLVSRYNIQRGNYVRTLCRVVRDPCSAGITSLAVNSLDIVFKRPNPDAHMKTTKLNTDYPSVMITLSSADGESSRKVIVRDNGLIEVK
ncbi:MAG: hypothetical protein A2541_00080 [Candidatus Taylorbacteria bacterium RIFOXYD2_FULL_36_9]|uniref:General secretion pathway GspH domain-containing protein n=1 Tax=Candidatus Taylorbacteria bacterium RIFOXYD2_FULL_36_9 TaxID=1802338 RepID=A0A1G2PEB3_9BACT|nr:MAG: hypothetical protein A2541_00080 [Candidatus Taylorbacteria bacterium RIFOXYD2_FULL_36_9]